MSKTYRSYWIGADRWSLYDSADPDAFLRVRTEELKPVSYTVEHREHGKVVESWKTCDVEKLRDHLTQLSEMMDAEPVDMTTRNLLELAIWCDSHDLDLMVRTF